VTGICSVIRTQKIERHIKWTVDETLPEFIALVVTGRRFANKWNIYEYMKFIMKVWGLRDGVRELRW
jgi:hypothetical protein